MKFFTKFALSVVAVCGLAAPAAASSFLGSFWYSQPGAGSVTPTPDETVICDFEGGDCGFTGDFLVQSGTNTFGAALPGNTSNYLTVPGLGINGTAVLSLAELGATTFSFDWGSIDTYNTLSWTDTTGFTTTVTGADVISSMFGDRMSPMSNQRFFGGTLTPGATIAELSFTSNGRAFEVDNLAANAVPEPATWMMIILGFGLIGFAMRRRRENDPAYRVRFS